MDSTKHHPKWLPYLMATVANSLYVINHSCLKKLTQAFTLFQVIYFMNTAILFLSCISESIWHSDLNLQIKNASALKLVCLRSLVAVFAIMLLLFNVSNIPVSFANTLFNLAPIFGCFVQAVLSNTKIQKNHLIITLVCFVGVLFILRPKIIFGQEYEESIDGLGLYICIGILSALCHSLSYILVKQLKKHISKNQVVLNYFYLFHSLISASFVNFQRVERPLILETWMLFPAFFLVVSLFVAQKFMYKSLYLGDPVLLMPFGYISVLVSLLIDIFYFKYEIQFLDLVGVSLTSMGLISRVIIK